MNKKRNKSKDYSHLSTSVLNRVIEITKLLVSSFDIETILDALKDYTKELIKCEKVIIWLVDEKTKTLYPYKFWGYAPEDTKYHRFKRGEGTVGWVYKNKKPILENDLKTSKHFIKKGDIVNQIRGVIQIPLIFEKKVIGVFDIANKGKKGKFTEEDLEILEVLGSFVAIALHNAFAFKEASRRLTLFKTLNEISKSMVNFNNLSKILQLIVENLAIMMDVDLCVILLLEGKDLVLRAAVGLPEKLIGEVKYTMDQGLIGHAARTKEIVVSEDAQNDPRFLKNLTSKVKDLHKSAMSTPILYEDKLLGVVSVETKFYKSFSEEEIQAFQILSNEIASGIHRIRLQKEMKDVYNNVIRIFSRIIELKEPETSGHCYRVSRMSEIISRDFNFSPQQTEELIIASYLHDIGKLGIPEFILHKNGKLSDSEFQVMRTHSEIGASILDPFNIPHDIKKAILYHHERYDGKGYPECLKGEEIPLMSRILTVADSFDAMVISRTYSTGKSIRLAVQELKSMSGKQFDPVVVKAFLKHLPEIKVLLTENPAPFSGG